ncbi:MAG: ShlB/FhaC/HecB family hemolysin secretion/activation protein [Burkholderiales bacterium]|nr:ShlB/FhaC/HecB family hemolysin secretion/activation protein [Burkholderiales bacterium]
MKRWPSTLAAALMALATLPALAQGSPPDAGALLRQTERDRHELLPPSSQPSPGLQTAPAPLPAASSAEDGARVTVRRFELRGNRLLSTPELQAALAPWLDRPAGLADLRRATAALEQLYRERGWLAQARLPAQDVSAGAVRIELVEARLGRIVFTPESSAVSTRLAAYVRRILQSDLPAGAPLNLRHLERSLLIAGELPGVVVSGSLQAGREAGSTDLLVHLARGVRRRSEIAFDNGGNRATGAARFNAQVIGNSIFDRGERLSLGLAATEGSQYLGAEANAPLPLAALADWRGGVHASALAYRVLPAMNTSAGLPPRGHTEVIGAALEYPLLRTPMASLTLDLGYDQRHVRDENSSLDPNALALADASSAGIVNLGLSGGRLDHVFGGGSTQASLGLSLGHLSLGASPASYVANDARTAATQGGYSVLHWAASRLQTLRPDLSLMASARGQLASKNLDPAEKMYLGGMNGVRAYPSGEAGGASGWMLNLELRKQLGPNWLASAFVDRGQVAQFEHNQRADGTGPLVASNRITLSGRGVAIEYRNSHGVVVKAGLARRNGSNPIATPTGRDSDGSLVRNRIWINASFAF